MANVRPYSKQAALFDARMAVRAYARDPSDINAESVEKAWLLVKMIDMFGALDMQPVPTADGRDDTLSAA